MLNMHYFKSQIEDELCGAKCYVKKALETKPIPTIDGEYNYLVDVQSCMKGLPFGQYEFSIVEVSGTFCLVTEDGDYRLPEELLGTLKEIQKETSLSEEW